MNRLYGKYKEEISPSLMKSLALKNAMQIPKIEKIVISSCLPEAVQNSKVLNTAAEELSAISGQKAVITKAKKSLANFKLREGMPLGVTVTLRGDRMWAFFDRLVSVALPRVRDFRGLSAKGFDGRGNYNMGLKEQIIFPEINYDKVDKVRGMNISICTSAKDDTQGKALLEAFGFPFRK
ncbi:MAG: 50S ribosomal protein L5 [Bdellovibrionales bacterium]|nr:50S ribosomal protein L5 [Bdellovibrionales bacterium]